jgi:glycosyltransferase involved in cell wall biosynthesis
VEAKSCIAQTLQKVKDDNWCYSLGSRRSRDGATRRIGYYCLAQKPLLQEKGNETEQMDNPGHSQLRGSTISLDVVVATHNRSRLLKRCLDSVFQAAMPQNLKVRVYVVDNNSTDDTKSVVEGFPGVTYLFVGKIGKSFALNEGLPKTSADLIGLIDDDERIDPTWFEVIYREFRDSPDLDYIGGPYRGDWEIEAPEWVPLEITGVIGVVPQPRRVQFCREFPGQLMGGNAVIRREVLLRTLPFPEHIGKIGKKIRSGADEVCYHRLLDMGANGVVVPDLIIHHWIPSSRLTKRYYRKWVIGRGIAQGSQLRYRGFPEAKLFGAPRYKFGQAARNCLQIVKVPSHRKRFTAQLIVLDAFATWYGIHFCRWPKDRDTENLSRKLI